MIEKHLDRSLIKSPVVECDTICAFTGEKIKEGVLKSKLLSIKFTDFDLIKYNSDYVSVGIALLLSNVIDNGKGRFNPLRNYSFYADKNGYRLLAREDILELLLDIPDVPEFQICVTYSNKKHIAYRSKPQINKNLFTVTTDRGNVLFDMIKVRRALPIIQSWYTILPGNKSKQEPTFFTKAEILGEALPNYNKITTYGTSKFFKENKKIEEFRGTFLLNFLVHILNKTKCE